MQKAQTRTAIDPSRNSHNAYYGGYTKLIFVETKNENKKCSSTVYIHEKSHQKNLAEIKESRHMLLP